MALLFSKHHTYSDQRLDVDQVHIQSQNVAGASGHESVGCCGSGCWDFGGQSSKVLKANYVLLGRGRRHRQHPGNILFSDLIKHNASRYDNSATHQSKQEIVREILAKLYESGAGFRRYDRCTKAYVPVDHETARQKVMHAIHHLLRRSKANKVVLVGVKEHQKVRYRAKQSGLVESNRNEVGNRPPMVPELKTHDDFLPFIPLDDVVDDPFETICREEMLCF